MRRLLKAIKTVKPYRLVAGALALALLAAMWFFSSQNGEESGRLSGRVLDFLLRLLKREVSVGKREKLAILIRKGAHFSLFMGLGFLSALALGSVQKVGRAWLALPACVLCAFIDEGHQYFVAARAAQLKDCAIDSAGALTGVFLAFCVILLLRRHERTKKWEDTAGGSS